MKPDTGAEEDAVRDFRRYGISGFGKWKSRESRHQGSRNPETRSPLRLEQKGWLTLGVVVVKI
jgi:nucleoid DNA-binding protein